MPYGIAELVSASLEGADLLKPFFRIVIPAGTHGVAHSLFVRESGIGDNIEQLVDSIETGETRNEDCEIDIVIDDISDGIATVRCYSCDYIDYLQIARLGAEWKLINVLWRSRRS